MITLKNVSKSFGFVKAVEDLSFEIKQGEIVGFLGPNGAGKTTTMRILTGFLAPDKGNVLINSISIQEDPTLAQKIIGYLPENNPLYRDMQVSEFLSVAASMSGVPKQKHKKAFDFVVDSVGIESVFYRPVNELSKGFKQRVGIAAALIHQPKIIIMDEPTEGLDPNQRTEIRSLIKKLAKNHTILMSTHVMQEAQAVCNRMLIINKGSIVADGTTAELSRSAKDEKIFEVEIEGNGVRSKLEAIEQITKIETGAEAEKFCAKIISQKDFSLQPPLMRLALKNNWTIWKLVEKQRKLEDIFQDLTRGK